MGAWEGFASLLNAVGSAFAPVVEFLIWVWPLKIWWLHDGERGIITTFGRVRQWRHGRNCKPGVVIYTVCEKLHACQCDGLYLDTCEQVLVTLDNRVILCNAAAAYRITSVRLAKLKTGDLSALVQGIVMDALRRFAGAQPTISDVLASVDDVLKLINPRCRRHGVLVQQILLSDLRPHNVQMACDAARESALVLRGVERNP